MATPAQVDELGGLPEDVESITQSVMLASGGRVLCSPTEIEVDSPTTSPLSPCSPGFEADTQRTVQAVPPQFAYKIKEQDTLECTWGKGYIKVEVAGELLFHVKSPLIFAPPRKKPAFAFMDCAGAVCRATLLV
jgi:hypothetical protein